MKNEDKKAWQAYIRGVKKVSAAKAVLLPPPRGEGRGGGEETKRQFKNNEKLPSSKNIRGVEKSLLSTPLLPNPKLERKREKAMRDGSFEIEARLDLHGMTQAEAFDALAPFICRNVKAGKRHLLIITGKGPGGKGILRTKLQDWLTQLPEAGSILALRPAALAHGGSGAFYVLLRRVVT